MNTDRYQQFVRVGNFTKDERDAKFLGGLGLAGESGEVADIIKKHLLHGKPLDREHLVEELGDVAWYLFHTLDTFGITLNEVLDYNVVKLCDRYPEGYGQPRDWGVEG